MRRKRSEMTKQQAVNAVAKFSKTIHRWLESSDLSAFGVPNQIGYHSVQIMAPGSFGLADDFFEALRVLGGHKLPRTTNSGDEKP